MGELIRIRYNTMSHEKPGGEWKWRVILRSGEQYEEVLVKQLKINVPSFSHEDEMPIVGRKYHIACYGSFRVEDGRGIVDPERQAPTGQRYAYARSKKLMNWRNHNVRLALLEAEAIHIVREAVAEFRNSVMLYSIGKDSSAMLHIAQKAFAPAKPPFPLLHIDTTWKFREMITFRDETAARLGMDLLVHINEEGLKRGISPVASSSVFHTQVMKTEGLRQALDKWRFDVAIGGARRDEEKSRAKERIFSHRSGTHGWNPRDQRPELWRLFNTRIKAGESMRVFPLSNWTELDVWEYIKAEEIAVVPLYFAKERPVVERDGALIMVDDDRLPLVPGETPEIVRIRFRTLGCYPLTGAIRSDAATLDSIIDEVRASRTSERQGRVIDHDESGSMEKKKREGYF